LFAEAIYDLPCLVTFEAPAAAPPVGEPPVRARGFVTFGCLNRFSKVSRAALEAWARILGAVPGSRLLLKDWALDDPERQSNLCRTLAALGIGGDRLELRGGTPHREHLAAYNDVDIVLDPFPATGGISTWEALWMGTPVVTKLGGNVSARVAGAILGSIGMADWVAEDEAGYIALAIRMAGEGELLARLRSELRTRILASPAGNADLYTRAVEAAYRAIWQRWCGSRPESFAVAAGPY
jgi:predicted O-linked N-acetylglucosamine transferase (SPINDLY family)